VETAPSAGERFWSRFSRSPARAAVVAVLCASAAFAYAHFVGCRTGTCPLTSNAWIASLYGGVTGAVLGWPNRRRDREECSPGWHA
jgi:membrane protease YdiL (CAAX protease family)